MSTAKKIRRYIGSNPNVPARQVADKFGVSVAYVYTLRSQMKKDAGNPDLTETDWKTVHVSTSNESIKDTPNKVTPAPAPATDVDATLAERGKRYGTFKGHATVTIALKKMIAAALFMREKKLADDQQEALDMICHKIGRIVNGDPDYADSWIDIAGYAKLVADRLETGKEV